MKSLYLDFDLSIRQIVELTDSHWGKTSITKALAGNGISKPNIPSRTRYGEKVVRGEIISDPKEQKNIGLILAMRKEGATYKRIANHLNDQKIRSKLGGMWSMDTVKHLIKREQARKEVFL